MAGLEQQVPGIKYLLPFCSNCGREGPHLARGQYTFYICKPNPELVKKKTAEIREKPDASTVSEA